MYDCRLQFEVKPRSPGQIIIFILLDILLFHVCLKYMQYNKTHCYVLSILEHSPIHSHANNLEKETRAVVIRTTLSSQ